MKRSSRANVEEGLAIHIPTYLFQSVGGYNLSSAMSLGTLSKSFKIGTPLSEETKRLYRSRHPPIVVVGGGGGVHQGPDR